MTRAEVDVTLFFTHLAQIDLKNPSLEVLKIAFYTDVGFDNFKDDFSNWLKNYAARILQENGEPALRLEIMQKHNPRYVLRNYLAQEAIDLAEQGDTSRLETLLDLLKKPYTQQAGKEKFEEKRPDWARHKAGCSMLSCSS